MCRAVVVAVNQGVIVITIDPCIPIPGWYLHLCDPTRVIISR
jgi:hypothetical protein